MFLTSVMVLPPFVLLRGVAVLRVPVRTWAIGLIAAFASLASYAVAVWAMTKAPIALVAAMRETSILFAVLIGWLIFGEKLGKLKAAAALLIVTGVVLTRL
jgi:drug/metabolite transporter (DMT)-like permease